MTPSLRVGHPWPYSVALVWKSRPPAPAAWHAKRPFAFTIPHIPEESARLDGHGYTLTLHSWDSTVPEQLLNRGGFAVVGLCLGLGAVWLRRVLTSIAAGRPFQPGNAARIAGMGGLVALASLANDILPVIGSNLVLQRLGLTGPSAPIYAEVVLSLGLLLAVPFFLVLAEAFRRSAELDKGTRGSRVSEHSQRPWESHRIACHLDLLLAERQMTLAALAEAVGLTVVNLSILKNDRAKAVRFSTLTRICDVLRVQPDDVFSLSSPAELR